MKPVIRVVVCMSMSVAWALGQVRPLNIYWIDVEGGAATLIVTPAGESLLVDAGEAVQRDATRIHDIAARVAGLKQIDQMVTTHWHSDHFGGVYGLSRLMPIRHFYANRALPTSLADQQGTPFEMMRDQYQKLVPNGPTVLHPGDTIPLNQATGGPQLTVKCLAAFQKVIEDHGAPNSLCKKVQAAPIDKSENLNSMVLLLQYGKFTFFDSGDLTKNMEAKLVCPSNVVGPVVLYQIAHHGLDQSNNPVLIESIRPKVVVVNNSATKGAERGTMDTLKNIPSIETVWQVHKNYQAAAGWNTADEYIANSAQTDDKAEFIQASVAMDGTFSVQIGMNGLRKVYKTP